MILNQQLPILIYFVSNIVKNLLKKTTTIYNSFVIFVTTKVYNSKLV